jgi:hypothetical protein
MRIDALVVDQPDDGSQERALAGTVGTDEPEPLAVGDLDGDSESTARKSSKDTDTDSTRSPVTG